jgi:hypothetical protein
MYKMEIYKNVKPVIFAELIGLGPVSDEKFSSLLGFKPRNKNLPPLIVQLITGELFSCVFDSTNLDDGSAISFNRNFLLPEDFDKVGLDYKIKDLIQNNKPLRLFLGDDWTNERFLKWEKCDRSIIPPNSYAISLGEGYKVARRMELIYEYSLWERICMETEEFQKKERSYLNWLHGRNQIEEIIREGLPWLIASELNKEFVFDNKKPGLDFYDNL